MSELFKLKPCEECNGTGDAHHQGHDYDCPDCLGTGYEEPAKRIMNLELMLNQHKETLKSGNVYNNELAQKFEAALEQRDRLAEEVGQLKSRLTQTMGAVTISRNGYVQELEQQRDRLAEALEHSMKHMRHSLNCPARVLQNLHPCNCQMQWAYNNTIEALQSLTSKP